MKTDRRREEEMIVALIQNGGYDHRAIAARVNDKPRDRVTDEELGRVRYVAAKRDARVGRWRRMETLLSVSHSRDVLRRELKRLQRRRRQLEGRGRARGRKAG